MIFFKLFLTFFEIGLFTFGGGYAMIPLIQKEAVENHKWVTDEDILNVVAIAESTPGPIAINAATFVGYQVAGFAGAVVATLGVVLPSFLVILAISYVLQQFRDLKAVAYAFRGIRVGVLVLLLKALHKMFKANKKGWMAYVLMGVHHSGFLVVGHARTALECISRSHANLEGFASESTIHHIVVGALRESATLHVRFRAIQ